MIGLKLLWLVLTLVLAALAVLTASWPLTALTVALILLPLLSLACNIPAAKRVKLTMTAPINLRKGAAGEAVLTLQNTTPLPICRAVCRVRATNLLTGAAQLLRAECALPPRAARTVPLTIASDLCGRVRLEVASLRLYDAFGLIGIRASATAHASVTVQPDTFGQHVTILPVPAQQADAETYAPDRPGYDLSEPYQIREYVPGDSQRQIHWKLSQKFGKLIVRDPSLPVTHDLAVFWERTQPDCPARNTDVQAEAVVTLCKTLLTDGVPFTLCWNDPQQAGLVQFPMQELDDLVAVLPRLLSAAASNGASGLAQLTQDSGLMLLSHLVYITGGAADLDIPDWPGQFTVLCCADAAPDAAVRFDAAHYTEQLQELTV